MRKIIIVTVACGLAACLIGAWSYASIKADSAAIAAGTFTPSSIEVMQFTRDPSMRAVQFSAF